MMDSTRLRRGRALTVTDGAVESVAPGLFRVRSSLGHGSYGVRQDGLRWSCECPDFTDRQLPCKHVAAVVEMMATLAGIPWPASPASEAVKPRPTYL